jgi:lantibiotic modifying enzyme
MSGSRWRAIVGGGEAGRGSDLSRRAIEAILSIASALREPVDDLGAGRPAAQAIDLADGSAGVALFFAHLSLASRVDPSLGDPDEWSRAAARHAEHAMDGVSRLLMGPGLYGGFTGVAWSLTHMARVLGQEPEAMDEIDEAVLDLVRRKADFVGDHDLVAGLVGMGVHALERLPDPVALQCAAEIVARLEETASRDKHGATWHTPAKRLAPARRAQCPDGYHDLGVAHGLTGIIAFLAESHAAGVEPVRSRRLLEDAVAWLFAHSLEKDRGGGYPWAYVPGVEPRPARSAWCYGDPGIAAVLQRTSICAGEPVWAERARALALHAARRPADQTGVADIGICHGSAGLAHLLNCVHQATGDSELREAALRWVEWTLAARVEGAADGVAGFHALIYEKGEPVRIAERGVLNGAAGVGLVLLAAVSDVPPAWDRLLLVSGGRP